MVGCLKTNISFTVVALKFIDTGILGKFSNSKNAKKRRRRKRILGIHC